MKFLPGTDQDVLDKASLVECDCMNCGNLSEITELIYTGDEESYKGYEVWVYCENCKTETFKIIE